MKKNNHRSKLQSHKRCFLPKDAAVVIGVYCGKMLDIRYKISIRLKKIIGAVSGKI